MTGSDRALYEATRLAYDGDAPVHFTKLDIAPPATERAFGRSFLRIPSDALATLAERAFLDSQYRLRPSFAAQIAAVAFDPEADERDRYVADTLVANALTSAQGVFPLCQDSGTATIYAWKGDAVLTELCGDDDDDAAALTRGALAAWTAGRFRNSQLAPLLGLGERNTGNNLPLSAHITAVRGSEYHFVFVAKGGGSANKTALYQETKRLLRPEAFYEFVSGAIAGLGVSACPPYRIAVVLGGQSPEETLLAAKLASAGALDALPSEPSLEGGVYRERELEAVVMAAAASAGWGAQFGGRFLARDARVVRLPRHAASLPVGIAVSCSAHRQVYGYVSANGYFVEQLADADELARIVDEAKSHRTSALMTSGFGSARRVDLGEPGTPAFDTAIRSLRAGELVELWGTAVLARDAVHARLQAMIDRGEAMPSWTRFPVFYAAPTGTPVGTIVGSIGPTTSKRMDSYLDDFMSRGVFTVTIGKGERGPECAAACAKHGGLYLAAVGGAAALAASRYIASIELIDWPELGMEAVRRIEFRGLPALVAVDMLGNDYYSALQRR
ncbi:MAG: fumarate hydratase [Spirochaetales bacterium]|nr:fumarate hydratase [Spirochaetales bacterium]